MAATAVHLAHGRSKLLFAALVLLLLIAAGIALVYALPGAGHPGEPASFFGPA